METVCEYSKCAGCMACVDICPKGAITIQDNLDAYNAVIDTDKCVDCNACHRVCQQNHPVVGSEPIQWYQGWAGDEDLRSKCSSGGAATALSKAFVEKGGVVCSCVFHEGQFAFDFAERLEDVGKFTGSKYVKSNPLGIYRKIKKKLRDGQRVLFIGLPCQVSALKNYVGADSDNLYTIDLICHGTPSPELLEMFVAQYGYSLANISSIDFRRKAKFQIKRDLSPIITAGVTDRYSIAFLKGLIYTDNCYSCKYANTKRVADITLGDSWGSTLPVDMIKLGVSLILCQTTKGLELVNDSGLVLKDVDVENAIERSRQLKHPSKAPSKRAYFFKGIAKGRKFNNLVLQCLPKDSIKQDIKEILIHLHLFGGGGRLTYQITIEA